MIKAVQKNLCKLPKANDVAQAVDLTTITSRNNNITENEDDDCIYISPDKTENG